MSVQQQILQQLGGNQFCVMVGAKCYSDGENTLVVKFKGSRKANIMYITLNSMDEYNVRICKWSNTKASFKVEEIATHDRAQCSDLRGFFERHTGLRTSLTHTYA